MGRKAREPKPDTANGEGAGITGEYSRPDAALAFKIYDQQIAPKQAHIATISGDLSQPRQDIKDKAHFPRSVLDFIIKLEGLEDAKRDHHMLALAEGLKHRKLFLPRDLVTMANGNAGGDVIQTGDADQGDDLATLSDDEDFTEASEEELAAQEGRSEPETGTGAAAIAAMKKAGAASPATAH